MSEELSYDDFNVIDLERAYANESIKGWISHEDRTFEQTQIHENIINSMPNLYFSDMDMIGSEKVDLTELWNHPQVVQSIGYAYPGVKQNVGSCVGAAGGNMFFTLMCVEVIRLNDPEQIVVPFWFIPYARSRLYAGMSRPGDGSMGSTYARAAKEDGIIEATRSGLPSFQNNNGLSWGARTETDWSDGDSKQVMDLLSESRKHIVQTVSQVRNTDELEQGIRKLFPATNASSLIPNARIEDDEEAYGRVARGGGHQTCFLGVWNNPRKGKRYFKYQNQWGLTWGKNGACWIPDEDAQAIINNGRETYLFSQHLGFPGNILGPEIFDIIGR